MPTRIEQLATMFETIIYKYYGGSSGMKTHDEEKDECTDEFELLHSKDMTLGEYIDESAKGKNITFGRVSLMKHLAHGRELIDIFLTDAKPLTPLITSDIQKELIKLIDVLKYLLNLPKTEFITIKYGDSDSFDKDVYGCRGCRSGEILQEILGSILKKTPEDIAEYIRDIVYEHQYPLLMSEYLRVVQENKRQHVEIEDMRKSILEKKTKREIFNQSIKVHPTYSIFQAITESAAAAMSAAMLPDESESPENLEDYSFNQWD